ncbi:MAG: metallophosphoesterase [Roseiarcus sp.]
MGGISLTKCALGSPEPWADPGERLRLCLAEIARCHADADLVVVTGDLAHTGEPAAYRAPREALDAFPLPTRLLIGNHDNRENFRMRFPEASVDEEGFVQSAIAALTAWTCESTTAVAQSPNCSSR